MLPELLNAYRLILVRISAKMAAKASLTTSVNNMVEMFNKKVEETLKENNMLTDLLGQAEAKTGLKKANIVAGELLYLVLKLLAHANKIAKRNSFFVLHFIVWLYILRGYCSAKL